MSDGYSEFGLLQRVDGIKGGAACLRDSGILVEFVAGRFAAGESIAELAHDYRRTTDDIEAAIRLVVVARGTNLDEQRAALKVEACVPLLRHGRLREPSSVDAVDPSVTDPGKPTPRDK